jgi:LPXTG-site transpeptidase (sortase) family protein
MIRILSSRLSIALGLLLAFYGITGSFSLLREGDPASERLNVDTSERLNAETLERLNVELAEALNVDAPERLIVDKSAKVVEGGGIPPVAPEISADQMTFSGATGQAAEEVIDSTHAASLAAPEIPVWISISAIGLAAPVIPAETKTVKVGGEEYQQWLAPDKFASGWHPDSAQLGETGNTVLNGHHNVFGEVFRYLVEVEIGDLIRLYSAESLFIYQVTNVMILPEKYEQIDVRMNNAQWILPSQDERLTLITCWPYESNTHRLILVAKPLARSTLAPISENPQIDQK